MKSFIKIQIFLALFCGFLLQACMTPGFNLPFYSREVARIDDMAIKEDVLRFRLRLEADRVSEKNFNEGTSQKVSDHQELKELLNRVLDKMVTDNTIVAYGKKQGVEISSEELEKQLNERKSRMNPKTFENILNEKNIPYSRWKQITEDELRVQYVLDKMLSKDLVVTESEIKNHYQKNIADYQVPERVRVRQIVTDSKEKSQEIYTRLLAGENFAKIAVNHSQSPDRARGGDLGYFAKGTYPKVFDDNCFKLKKGELSPVVKSEYGYHIFKLLDRKPAGEKTLLEVAGQIHQIIFEEKLKTKYDVWFETVKKEIKVMIDQEILDSFVL